MILVTFRAPKDSSLCGSRKKFPSHVSSLLNPSLAGHRSPSRQDVVKDWAARRRAGKTTGANSIEEAFVHSIIGYICLGMHSCHPALVYVRSIWVREEAF